MRVLLMQWLQELPAHSLFTGFGKLPVEFPKLMLRSTGLCEFGVELAIEKGLADTTVGGQEIMRQPMLLLHWTAYGSEAPAGLQKQSEGISGHLALVEQ